MKIRDLISAKSEVALNLQKSIQRYWKCVWVYNWKYSLDRFIEFSKELNYYGKVTLIKLRAKRGEAIAAKLSRAKDIDEQNKII